MVRFSMVWYGITRYDMVRLAYQCMVQYSHFGWYGMAWYSKVYHGMLSYGRYGFVYRSTV